MKMSDGYADACRVGLETAIKAAGGQAPLAEYLRAFGLVKVTPKTIAQWVGTHLPKAKRGGRQAKIPAEYVQTVHRATGVPMGTLRPDLYTAQGEGAYIPGFEDPECIPSDHSAVLGGSIADRRAYCKGSYTLEKSIVEAQQSEPQTTPAAERGIALHEAMEHFGRRRPKVADWVDGNTLEARMRSYVGSEFYDREISKVDMEDALVPAVRAAWEAVTIFQSTAPVRVETQVSLPTVPGAFGTADMLVGPDSIGYPGLVVLDYKFGQKLIPAENNFGLMFYAAAALFGPELSEQFAKVDSVRLAIVQPTKPKDKRLETWDTTRERLREAVDVWKENCRVFSDFSRDMLTPGWHCTYCKVRPVCGVYADSFSTSRRKLREVTKLDRPATSIEPASLEAFANIGPFKK